MARLGEIAKKVAVETAATASAPVLAMGGMAKNVAISYLGRLNPLNTIRLPGMDMIRVINEMRKDVVSKLEGSNDNKISPEKTKREEQIAKDVDDSVDLLKDIRDRLDDLLELFGRKEKREIRREKIEKHKNIDYDTKADFDDGGENLKPHKNFKGWISKLMNIRGLWKHALKALLPASIGIYLGLKALDKGFTQIGSVLKTAMKPVKSIFTTIGRFSGNLTRLGVFLKGILKPFGKALKAIRSIPVGPILEKVFGLSRAIRGLGKYVFGPVTMTLFGIFEFVNGFLDSYKKDGSILKALGAGIDDLIKGFTVKPLDLLKDIVSWAANKLGFDNVSQWLDSWSFEDLYERLKGIASDGINTVYEVFKNHFKRIGGYVSKYVEEYIPSYDEVVKNLQEDWNTFTNAVNNITGFIKDLVTNPSKVWEEVKKQLPDFSKITEELLEKIPSFEDIQKELEGFSFTKFMDKIKKTLSSFRKWFTDFLKDIPILGNFVNIEEKEKKPPVPEKFSALPEKELKKRDYNRIKEFVVKMDKEKQSNSNVTINVNENKNLVTGNQNTTDVTPNVLITTPYSSRWESD